MAAYTVCRNPKCATLIEGKVDACPKCGGPMRTVGESPLRGIALIVLGVIIAGVMGVITYYTYPTMMNPGVSIDGSRFTGTPAQAQQALTLFAALIIFGVVAIVNGIYMLITKQQSKVFIFLSLGLAAALIIMTFVILGQAKSREEPERAYYSY